MELSRYLDRLALARQGLAKAPTPEQLDKQTFVNDYDSIHSDSLLEGRAWLGGSSDEILRFYGNQERIDYNTEPWYYRNKRSYFWARSSLEREIKRTHSGFAKDIVDTDVTLMGWPLATVQREGAEARLRSILSERKVRELAEDRQEPLTLVDGWGCYKIWWEAGDPIPRVTYYDAMNVRFYGDLPCMDGVSFMDWYTDASGKRYLSVETRMKSPDGKTWKAFYDVFRDIGSGNVMQVPNANADALFGKKPEIVDLPLPFAVPCKYYDDPDGNLPGRSIYAGKFDVFDDIDQAFSQMSNAVRRSTPVETFDLDYCERDRDGTPRMPRLFERMYVGVRGTRNAYGESNSATPVQVSQPRIDISLYKLAIETLMKKAISGHLSPVTMAIDTERGDSADSKRESEKVTVFTRNRLCERQASMLSSLFNQLLVADQYLRDGNVSCLDYGVTVQYTEFSNVSFESRITTMTTILANGAISPRMFVRKVYNGSLSKEEEEGEIKWIEDRNAKDVAPTVQPEPSSPSEEGDDYSLDGILKEIDG